jgi:hypothetical protein
MLGLGSRHDSITWGWGLQGGGHPSAQGGMVKGCTCRLPVAASLLIDMNFDARYAHNQTEWGGEVHTPAMLLPLNNFGTGDPCSFAAQAS